MTKKTVLTALIAFVLGIFIGQFQSSKDQAGEHPVKVVAQNDSYSLAVDTQTLQWAKLWCEKQIAEGNPESRYFKAAIGYIERKDIRWSINDPYGLHYSMVLAFARAWEETI